MIVFSSEPVKGFQKRIVKSNDADAIFPSGRDTNAFTVFVCPAKLVTNVPESVFHIVIVNDEVVDE